VQDQATAPTNAMDLLLQPGRPPLPASRQPERQAEHSIAAGTEDGRSSTVVLGRQRALRPPKGAAEEDVISPAPSRFPLRSGQAERATGWGNQRQK